LDQVKLDHPKSEGIAIMGSGNWKFSLNPYKNFSEFHKDSDIDIAIVCPTSYENTWGELRDHHRKNYYLLTYTEKKQLRRNGENVYSGFISPKWLPLTSKLRFHHMLKTNIYSNAAIQHRTVNMMYFKNEDEVLDYYIRGFRAAQIRNLDNGI
jgi:hypothetical protein